MKKLFCLECGKLCYHSYFYLFLPFLLGVIFGFIIYGAIVLGWIFG